MAEIKAYLSKNCSVCDDQKKEFKKLRGKVKIKRIDVDKHPDKADKAKITFLPTMIVCGKRGCKRINSFADAEQIERELNE